MGGPTVYHCINISDACQFQQPLHRLLLAKQAKGDKILKDMKD
jgi:hypothetical protein